MMLVSNNISSNTVQLQLILILIILFLLIIIFPHLRSILYVISGFRREICEICALLGITTLCCVICQKSANLLDQLFIYSLNKKQTGKYNPTHIERSEQTSKNNRTKTSRQKTSQVKG
jgi:ABC-type siderophore export system fused ATPase/permease subunit